MAILEWSPRFETGIASVDFEHRSLIEQINWLTDQVVRNASGDKIEQVLGEIHASISAHFALEETIMREHDYEDFKAHKADHERLLDEIRVIMDQCRMQSRDETEATLGQMLDSWFSAHFRTRDAKLHRILPASR